MLALRRIYHLEIWLIIAMAATLMFSITRHTEHAPHWSLWIGAGLLAFFMCAQPKLTGAVVIAILAAMIALAHGFGLPAYSPVLFAGELAGELLAWIYDISRAGIRLAWTFSSLVIFLVVYLQLLLVARGKNIAPLILLGLTIYAYLWHNRYADVEAGMFMFFALAFPTASFIHIRNRSKLDRIWYKAGIICLSIVSAFLVSIAPWDLGRLEVPEDLRLLSDPQMEETGLSGDTGTGSNLPATFRMSGYSPGSDLGGSVSESQETVLRLELVEGSFPSSLYLRGRASDYYTGSSWEKRNAQAAEDLEEAFGYFHSYEAELAVRVDYLKEEADLFGLFPTRELKISGSEDKALNYTIDSFGNLQSPEADFAGEYFLSGKVISKTDFSRKDRDRNWRKIEELAPFLQVPEELPERVRELAVELTEGAGKDKAKAERIENYLRQYPYTRESEPLPKGKDFVDHFLFELEEGYCSYFASAMVILLRLNNIPARYVEGYRVSDHYEEHHLQIHPEDPDLGRSVRTIHVRQNNAHAWVEVFLQGYGWVAYEPTSHYGMPLGFGLVEEGDPLSEDEEPASAVTDDRKSPFGKGAFFYGAAGLLGLLASVSFVRVYLFYSRSKTPADLYARVIKVRTAFSGLPLPGETPGMIVEQLKKELPVFAGEFEQMKKLYHLQRYAGNQGKAGKVQSELTSLPLRAAAVYRSKMGMMEYARGLFQLFLLSLLPGNKEGSTGSLNPAKIAVMFLQRQDSKPGPLN